jgi:hypothetical protein
VQGGPGLLNAAILGFAINLSGTATTAIAILGQNHADITFRDLYITGSAGPVPGQLAVIGGVDNTSFANNHSQRVHVDHCTFANCNVNTYESLLLVSCDESTVSGCKFYNVTTTSSPLGVYAYCNGVVVDANTFRACSGSILIVGGQNVMVCGNTMRNGANINDVVVKNFQKVQLVGNSFSGQLNSNAIELEDGSGLLDGHPQQFPNSSDLMVGSSNFANYYVGVMVQPAGPGRTASQTNIAITNNIFSNVTTPLSTPSSVTPVFKNNP